jgi:hypothetical protein
LIAKGIHLHRGTRGWKEDSMKVGNNEGRNEEGREELRMHRNKEVVSEEEDEFGVLRNGRRYKRLKTGIEK